eukprot:TRINITY_DN3654_c0_g4_i1.p1 TRINITY_DN3654_c0_g4~~TRINITY_DN3654_c0_g4_i1.p1  ORF type:complete len:471 (-),score=66.82 TRINITY_DN3654_c0_g4_i1:25-1437(-)
MTSAQTCGFSKGFEAAMDSVLENAVRELPGVVVLARRNGETYCKAKGFANMEDKQAMETDVPFRMYSMTKVMTSALALLLRARTGEPSLEDEVSKYIPSFQREWDVVEENASGAESVGARSLIAGVTDQIAFGRRRAGEVMRVKHLMAECSGIGYECFGDADAHVQQGALSTRLGYSIANALRRKVNPTVYTSSCILGHDLSLAQFCDVLAEAGVLCTDPGVMSYGLGATVLGRVLEVVYEKHYSAVPLRDIFQRELFGPLGMTSATFFNEDLVSRLPVLYGLKPDASKPGEVSVVRAEVSVPPMEPPYSNHTDHFQGSMRYDSGDTGAVMTVADYAKFLDCLLAGGLAADGSRVLPAEVVESLLYGRHEGLSYDTGVGRMMGLSDSVPFTFGWVSADSTATTPAQCYWSGYAGTHVRLYPKDNSYIIQAVQCMDHSFTGALMGKFRDPCLATFLGHWATDRDEPAEREG